MMESTTGKEKIKDALFSVEKIEVEI